MRRFLIFVCLLSLSGMAFMIYDYVFYKEKVYRKSKKDFQLITLRAAQELDTLARQVMEGVFTLKVPLKVNISGGENWARAH